MCVTAVAWIGGVVLLGNLTGWARTGMTIAAICLCVFGVPYSVLLGCLTLGCTCDMFCPIRNKR